VVPLTVFITKLVYMRKSHSLTYTVIPSLLCKQMNKDFVAANKGCNLLNDPLSLSRLYEAAESAKIELSKGQSTSINLPFITADAAGPKVCTACTF
jgi:hypothetical protein